MSTASSPSPSSSPSLSPSPSPSPSPSFSPSISPSPSPSPSLSTLGVFTFLSLHHDLDDPFDERDANERDFSIPTVPSPLRALHSPNDPSVISPSLSEILRFLLIFLGFVGGAEGLSLFEIFEFLGIPPTDGHFTRKIVDFLKKSPKIKIFKVPSEDGKSDDSQSSPPPPVPVGFRLCRPLNRPPSWITTEGAIFSMNRIEMSLSERESLLLSDCFSSSPFFILFSLNSAIRFSLLGIRGFSDFLSDCLSVSFIESVGKTLFEGMAMTDFAETFGLSPNEVSHVANRLPPQYKIVSLFHPNGKPKFFHRSFCPSTHPSPLLANAENRRVIEMHCNRMGKTHKSIGRLSRKVAALGDAVDEILKNRKGEGDDGILHLGNSIFSGDIQSFHSLPVRQELCTRRWSNFRMDCDLPSSVFRLIEESGAKGIDATEICRTLSAPKKLIANIIEKLIDSQRIQFTVTQKMKSKVFQYTVAHSSPDVPVAAVERPSIRQLESSVLSARHSLVLSLLSAPPHMAFSWDILTALQNSTAVDGQQVDKHTLDRMLNSMESQGKIKIFKTMGRFFQNASSARRVVFVVFPSDWDPSDPPIQLKLREFVESLRDEKKKSKTPIKTIRRGRRKSRRRDSSESEATSDDENSDFSEKSDNSSRSEASSTVSASSSAAAITEVRLSVALCQLSGILFGSMPTILGRVRRFHEEIVGRWLAERKNPSDTPMFFSSDAAILPAGSSPPSDWFFSADDISLQFPVRSFLEIFHLEIDDPKRFPFLTDRKYQETPVFALSPVFVSRLREVINLPLTKRLLGILCNMGVLFEVTVESSPFSAEKIHGFQSVFFLSESAEFDGRHFDFRTTGGVEGFWDFLWNSFVNLLEKQKESEGERQSEDEEDGDGESMDDGLGGLSKNPKRTNRSSLVPMDSPYQKDLTRLLSFFPSPPPHPSEKCKISSLFCRLPSWVKHFTLTHPAMAFLEQFNLPQGEDDDPLVPSVSPAGIYFLSAHKNIYVSYAATFFLYRRRPLLHKKHLRLRCIEGKVDFSSIPVVPPPTVLSSSEVSKLPISPKFPVPLKFRLVSRRRRNFKDDQQSEGTEEIPPLERAKSTEGESETEDIEMDMGEEETADAEDAEERDSEDEEFSPPSSVGMSDESDDGDEVKGNRSSPQRMKFSADDDHNVAESYNEWIKTFITDSKKAWASLLPSDFCDFIRNLSQKDDHRSDRVERFLASHPNFSGKILSVLSAESTTESIAKQREVEETVRRMNRVELTQNLQKGGWPNEKDFSFFFDFVAYRSPFLGEWISMKSSRGKFNFLQIESHLKLWRRKIKIPKEPSRIPKPPLVAISTTPSIGLSEIFSDRDPQAFRAFQTILTVLSQPRAIYSAKWGKSLLKHFPPPLLQSLENSLLTAQWTSATKVSEGGRRYGLSSQFREKFDESKCHKTFHLRREREINEIQSAAENVGIPCEIPLPLSAPLVSSLKNALFNGSAAITPPSLFSANPRRAPNSTMNFSFSPQRLPISLDEKRDSTKRKRPDDGDQSNKTDQTETSEISEFSFSPEVSELSDAIRSPNVRALGESLREIIRKRGKDGIKVDEILSEIPSPPQEISHRPENPTLTLSFGPVTPSSSPSVLSLHSLLMEKSIKMTSLHHSALLVDGDSEDFFSIPGEDGHSTDIQISPWRLEGGEVNFPLFFSQKFTVLSAIQRRPEGKFKDLMDALGNFISPMEMRHVIKQLKDEGEISTHRRKKIKMTWMGEEEEEGNGEGDFEETLTANV